MTCYLILKSIWRKLTCCLILKWKVLSNGKLLGFIIFNSMTKVLIISTKMVCKERILKFGQVCVNKCGSRSLCYDKIPTVVICTNKNSATGMQSIYFRSFLKFSCKIRFRYLRCGSLSGNDKDSSHLGCDPELDEWFPLFKRTVVPLKCQEPVTQQHSFTSQKA